MSNATALRTVLKHIKQHPADWRQVDWSNCFAGHTLRLLAGATEGPSECFCGCTRALLVDGRALYGNEIGAQAAKLLELDVYQAERLFAGSNSLERLKALVEEFIAQDVEAMALAA